MKLTINSRSKSLHLWSYNPEAKTIVSVVRMELQQQAETQGGGEGEGQMQWRGEGGEESEQNKKKENTAQAGLQYNLLT